MNKYLYWVSALILCILVLWFLFQLLYFNSTSVTESSTLSPSISYEVTENPYASFNVNNYSHGYEEKIKEAMGKFAEESNLKIKYSTFIQIETMNINLTNEKVNINIVQVTPNFEYLGVYFYKEKSWDKYSQQNHLQLIERLIEVFESLDLQVSDVNVEKLTEL